MDSKKVQQIIDDGKSQYDPILSHNYICLYRIYAFLCFACILVIGIPVIVIISLIPLYLSKSSSDSLTLPNGKIFLYFMCVSNNSNNLHLRSNHKNSCIATIRDYTHS